MGVVFIKTIHKKHGFTLVELIVILSILAILATLLIPSLTGYIEKAKKQAVLSEAKESGLLLRLLCPNVMLCTRKALKNLASLPPQSAAKR